ncbi:MAG: sulfotransferase family 2 domain-containing protein [Halioglobus sp.]|nr:sulfotransferase family 2 domain-containing protein [Halioglobus sp.]
MTPPADRKFLFIHIMKTGGTSFADIIAANFAADQRYPDACVAADAGIFRRIEAYLFVPGLVADVNALQGRLRMVRGHIPYATRSLLQDRYIAMTLLRDPVERTLSYLKHCRRYHTEHQQLTLEAIYEDRWFYESFIHNYQTKLFSMTAEEALAETRLLEGAPELPSRREMGDGSALTPEIDAFRQRSPGRVSLECFAASTGVIRADDERLALAMDNLSAVEVVGVTEHYDRFLRRLIDEHGWRIAAIPHRHAGESEAVSPQFRKRIAVDNALDMELYAHAKSLASAGLLARWQHKFSRDRS